MFNTLNQRPEMLSANDLLEIFPISRSGIYDLLREPGFPCIHLGRRIIVPRDALIDWLEKRMQEDLKELNTHATSPAADCEEVSRQIVKPHETITCDDGLYIELLSQDTDGASVI